MYIARSASIHQRESGADGERRDDGADPKDRMGSSSNGFGLPKRRHRRLFENQPRITDIPEAAKRILLKTSREQFMKLFGHVR